MLQFRFFFISSQTITTKFLFSRYSAIRYKEASIEYNFSGENMRKQKLRTVFHRKGHTLGFCDKPMRHFVFSFLKNGLPFSAMFFTIIND